MIDYYGDFSEYLYIQKSVSKNTLESYLRDVKKYFLFLKEIDKSDPSCVETDTINQYIQVLKERGRSSATITRSAASLRSFYRFMQEQGYVQENPVKKIQVDKTPKKLPEILTGEEIEQLLAQPDIAQPKGCRDKAMLELLYATGIRVSELIELNVQDINLQNCTLHCQNEKSERTIPVYTTAVSAISDYLCRVRSVLVTSSEERALFTNLNGQRMTRQGFWKIVKGYTEQAGITKEITPHTLRHSFALHLLKNGAELKDIQLMLGHADISSTQVYVQLLDTLDNHVKKVYNNCHPRAKTE